MFNFGVSFSPAEPILNFYRFSATAKLLMRTRIPLPYPCSLHDFGLSTQYAVFHISPHLLNVDQLRHEGRTTMQSLTWEPERGRQLLILNRTNGQLQAAIPFGRGYCLHQINAFEENGRLTVDLVEYERPIYDQYQIVPDLFTTVPPGKPVRLVVDAEQGKLIERRELAYSNAPDFPVVAPSAASRPSNDFWALGISATGRLGRKFFDQLVHASWSDGAGLDIYHAPPRCYVAGEPAFVANPADPKQGAIICPIFNAEERATTFAIFDAFAVRRGPAATVRLRTPIHLGFHATFLASRGTTRP
jgi:carotenoid cleavage dioxygenase-like enzyme